MQCVRLSEERARLRITVVTHLSGNSGLLILKKILKVLDPLCSKLYVVSECALQENGGKIKVTCIPVRTESRLFLRAVNCLSKEIRLTLYASRIFSQSEVIAVVGTSLVLPTILAKLHGKKVLLIRIGSPNRSSRELYGNVLLGMGRYILPIIFRTLEVLNYILADRIIVYSKRIVEEDGLERYSNKLCIAHEHFLDFNLFRAVRYVNDREDTIGYIGRIDKDKGVLDFVKALPIISEKRKDTRFVIGGYGTLFEKIKEYILDNGLDDRVELLGQVSHDSIPRYLNAIKILVLPSYTEGLPNIMLEAMACGTPVLATPVGAIPDMVKDGETGFILESNDSKHIADKVISLLDKPQLLEKVSRNASKWVRENFSKEKNIKTWQKILKQLKITK